VLKRLRLLAGRLRAGRHAEGIYAQVETSVRTRIRGLPAIRREITLCRETCPRLEMNLTPPMKQAPVAKHVASKRRKRRLYQNLRLVIVGSEDVLEPIHNK